MLAQSLFHNHPFIHLITLSEFSLPYYITQTKYLLISTVQYPTCIIWRYLIALNVDRSSTSAVLTPTIKPILFGFISW